MSTPPPRAADNELTSETRRYGVGLRAQTLLALTAAFVLCFSALSVIIVQVAHKSEGLERSRRTRALADALVQALGLYAGPDIGETLDEHAAHTRATERALAALVGHADVVGVRLESAGAAALTFGNVGGTPDDRTKLPKGELSLWIKRASSEVMSPLAGLLRLYSLVTGGLILLIVYIVLTRLIVRPVEDLTRAVERVTTTTGDAAIRARGAAELVRLALSFNRMARELSREKRALEVRLAELEETTRVLRSTQDQLIRSEKLAGVGRLAAGIAHEIGNPLAAILGLVELLQTGSMNRSDESEFLTRIRGETERIHRIIRDLLDYARTRPGEGEAAVADLDQVVEEAVALVAPQKDLRKVTLERRVFGTDLRVRASAHELTQILVNLLLNAADAVAGEGQILIELTRSDDGMVQAAISDSGPGIPAEVRDKLFEPFVTSKAVGKGTGLGLAVCHAIVERLGGTIVGENLSRRGARFVVRLPSA